MVKHYLFTVFSIFCLTSFTVYAEDSLDLIRLVDPLDEPEYYCLDLAGWGDHLKLDDPLQAHTCKTGNASDQLFRQSGKSIKVGDTDRCVQVAISSGQPLPGSAIIARTCTGDNPMQSFTFEQDGRIRISDTDLCLGAGMESTAASGPSHLWRVLEAVRCDAVDPAYTTWQMGLR